MLACGRKGEEDKAAPFLKEVYSRHWIVAEAAKMVGELGSGEAARLIFHGKSELMLSFRWQRTDASKVYTAQPQEKGDLHSCLLTRHTVELEAQRLDTGHTEGEEGIFTLTRHTVVLEV